MKIALNGINPQRKTLGNTSQGDMGNSGLIPMIANLAISS
jgi:hypothetical protein